MKITRLRVCLNLICVCFFLLFAAFTGRAQVTTADVVGRVTDSSGAIVTNAKITLQNLATGAYRSMNTTDSGDYTFNLLPIGRYSVRMEAAGFKAYVVQELSIAAGDRARVDAVMQVGQVSESVTVTTEAPVLQTDSATLGTLLDHKAVQDIPLNGRNYIQLAQLAPGVTPGPGNALSSGTRPDDRRQSSAFSVNGQDPVANNNMIDGADNNERVIGTIGVRPSIDAIAEFKVQTNLYTAEVGRTSGGVINILTKFGSNSLHGSLFEFLRNDKFDADSFYNFTNTATAPAKPEFRQNQFGGSVGGPIKQDKTFFFGDYEGLRFVQGVAFNGFVVPTAKERIGDFSESCTEGFNGSGLCNNSAHQISIVNAIGSAPVGPIPFNRLDLAPYNASLDPLGLKIAALYPQPTGPAIISNNYTNVVNRTYYGTTFDVRVDHHFTGSTTLFGRYSFNDVTTVTPTLFPNVGGINPGGNPGGTFPGTAKVRAQNFHLNFVHVFRPNLLIELKASYLRSAIQSLPVNAGIPAATTLGFPCTAASCVNTGDRQTFGLPQVNIQGFQGVGDAPYVPLLQFDNAFQYSAALTWAHGAHNVKVGAPVIRRQFSITQSSTARGSFSFDGSTASAQVPVVNGTANGSTSTNDGAGLANLLLGAPVTLARNATLIAPRYRTWEPSVYVQDDWRATAWLTLNLGLRYDIFTPKVEVNNLISNFDPATGVLLAAGLNSSRTTNITTDYRAAAPRVGFAATFGKGMVLRGGFGLSFFPGDYTSPAALKNPPFSFVLSCGPSTGTACPSGFGTLSQGVPVPNLNFSVVNGPTGPTIAPRGALRAIDTSFKDSFMEQFNLTLEKQFGNNEVSVGYVGQRGRSLVMDIPDINRALPSGTATANPKPDTNIPAAVASVEYLTTAGVSSYNALQMGFQRRYSRGLTLTSSYTYAHGISDITGLGTSTGGYGTMIGPLSQAIGNIASYDRSTNDFDIKHRWTLGANYELPFGKSLKGASGLLVGGWQVNGSYTWQTGLPITVTNTSARSGITGVSGGSNGDRPDLVKSSVVMPNPTVGVNGQWIDPKAFNPQALNTLGNSPRNVASGPHQSAGNLSLFKTFDLTEAWKLQFRAESFNLMNHPNFDRPNTLFGDPNFGKVTARAPGSASRQLQFALKLLF